MRTGYVTVIALFFLLLSSAAAFDLDGQLKSQVLYQRDASPLQPASRFHAQTLRLDFKGQAGRGSPMWHAAVEQLLLHQHPDGSFPLPDYASNRIHDLTWDWNSGHVLSAQGQIDRLFLQWDQGDSLLTLGRQAVGFGRISLVSPLDVIAPFPPTALESEIRPGSDALRMQYFYGVVGEVSATLVFADRIKRSSAVAGLVNHVGETDILLLCGYLRNRLLAGIGLAGQLGGLGWTLEWAGYETADREVERADLQQQFNITGAEIEYRFPFDLVVQLEYLYNGAGAGQPAEYPGVVQSAAFREGLSYFLGEQYLLVSLAYELTPLLHLSTLYIDNLEDHSHLLRPLLNVSLGDNASLELFSSHVSGAEARVEEGVPRIRSEFGSLGTSAGLFLNFYF